MFVSEFAKNKRMLLILNQLGKILLTLVSMDFNSEQSVPGGWDRDWGVGGKK